MKYGRTLQQLSAELERQHVNKRDFAADTRHLSVAARPLEGGTFGDLTLKLQDEKFPLTPYAQQQIADDIGMPRKYFDLLSEPKLRDLLVENINTLFQRNPQTRLVRTLDGEARAVLSRRYRTIDNEVAAEAVLPELFKQPEMRVESCELTALRMYMKVVFPRIQGEVRVGDVVQFGLVISNSEVGAGAFSVRPMIFTLACLNGMIRDIGGSRHVHLGRGREADEARELYRDETLQADDRALILKLQDTTRALISQDAFAALLNDLRESATRRLESPIADVVEVTAKQFSLREAEKTGLLQHLAMGGDFTQYGLANAVTRMSQDVEEYDRATELERIGGRIIELPRQSWQEIALAA